MNTFHFYLAELFDRTFQLEEYQNGFSFFVQEKGGRLEWRDQ